VIRLAVLAAAAAIGVPAGATATGVRVTVDDGKVRYIEGYVWFLGLDGRHRIVRERTATLRASASWHSVSSYVRPCDGNCSVLDGPTNRCKTRVRFIAERVRRAVVHLGASGTCRIELRG
jgi:hypothetical protein